MSSADKIPTPAETLDIAFEINKILDCGLDKDQLSTCIALLETGVNPEALAEVVKRLRKEAAKARQAPDADQNT